MWLWNWEGKWNDQALAIQKEGRKEGGVSLTEESKCLFFFWVLIVMNVSFSDFDFNQLEILLKLKPVIVFFFFILFWHSKQGLIGLYGWECYSWRIPSQYVLCFLFSFCKGETVTTKSIIIYGEFECPTDGGMMGSTCCWL